MYHHPRALVGAGDTSKLGKIMATASDVWKTLVAIPTRALAKRYQRTAPCDKAKSAEVLHEYKRFLVLKVIAVDFEDEALAAPPPVLQMWQQHVLDTASYAEACQTLCGQTIHHSPDAGNGPTHVRRCHLSLALYRKHFGEDPPTATWDFGELAPLSAAEAALLEDAPATKRRKAARSAGAAAAVLNVSVLAPFLPLRSLTVGADATVGSLFDQYVAASGANHLVAGRRGAVPPTTRLRCGSTWMHDLQQLCDVDVKEGSVVYVSVPQERRSRDECALTVKDVKEDDVATLFVRPSDAIAALMLAAQDALGVPADSQNLIFKGRVLRAGDSVEGCGLVDGCTVQMAVGRRRQKEAQLSPGGTWRVPD